MSKLQELINEYCPDGVEYKSLGDLGAFYGGLSGKSKDDFKDGNAKFITYMNVYLNPSVNLHTKDKVKISPNEKQRTLQYGDIIFTGSSETPDECGISSVITEKIDEPIYLNSFCFFFRLNNPEILNPDFAKHLFRSHELRYQIGKTASGVTRFNVSKKQMEKVIIPIPPLAVQSEIVRILDHFTLLTAELTAELTARKKQYEYYRDEIIKPKSTIQQKLLGKNFDFSFEIYEKPLSDISVNISDGMHNLPKTVNYNTGHPVISAQNIIENSVDFATDKFVTEDVFEKENKRTDAKEGDVLLTIVGAIGRTAIMPANDGTLFQRSVCVIKPNRKIINPKFLKYYLDSGNVQDYIFKQAHGAAQKGIYIQQVKNITVPIIPLDLQNAIVNILENFYSICTSLSTGLPAEIEARKKQYEYYRDKLLTFKAKA